MADFVTACRAQGLRVGLYHSLLDWHHPEFPLDGLHPQRDDGDKGGRDIRLYREYLHNQLRELVSTYTPDLLWFDFSYPPTWEGGTASPYGGWGGKGRDDWGSAELVSMVRSLAPKALINDRLDLPGSEDYLTPEELTLYATPTRNGVPVPWETCRTMNGSFGYAPSFEDWFEPRGAIRLLVDAVSKDGNLLLNVGPTPRGEIGVREERLLIAVGEWMKRHSPAVYGAGASKVVAPEGCLTTERAGRVYLHFFDWPSSPVVISGLGSRVRYASFLHDGLEVRAEILDYKQLFTPHQRPPGPEGSLAIYLPRKPPEVTVPVVELVLDPVA